MSAIAKIHARITAYWNGAPLPTIEYWEFNEALSEAWELGKRAEAQMWSDTADLTTPDEDREQGHNPFKEAS